ncbi:MAG: tRNA (adenosine(37)-N6)-dimethylallyltransferase MiaA [Candidatus Pacebacteria bacterium]|nr:tRNA (adenosine(37)-N6)-dimethylallyltransferase MiaA [Candidatus Paceibacterota bacterium]
MKEKELNQKPKIIVVCGPTATGKSDYAVTLAKKTSGEIISADSRQVYKGLDIGSGKITKKEMRGVPHHLLDVVSPKKVFTVEQFQKLGKKAISNILKKGKTPIICGGTGFYIDALVYESNFPAVPPNKSLRTQLEKKSVEELFELVQEKDPERADTIDSKNKVRLIRALEIIDAIGKVPNVKKESTYDVEWIGLDFPDEILKERIHNRLLARIKKGMLKEAHNLHTQGLSWKRMRELGLEYRFMADYLTGKISKDEMITLLETAIWQYAKRQRTWFKRNKEIRWVK